MKTNVRLKMKLKERLIKRKVKMRYLARFFLFASRLEENRRGKISIFGDFKHQFEFVSWPIEGTDVFLDFNEILIKVFEFPVFGVGKSEEFIKSHAFSSIFPKTR